ncbi:MAG: YceI family protein [Candidatus Krumholzibacteria bacterium]
MLRTTCLVVVALVMAVSAVALAPGGAAASDFAMDQIYTIDGIHSYVGFKIKYMGFAKVRGRFPGFSGTIRFDENDVTRTSATMVIEVASLDTENDRRDKDLKSDQWLDAEAFPTMTFRSKRAVKTDVGFDLIGDLTVRDVTHEVRIVMDEFSGLMKDIRDDTQVIFVGHTEISRKAFGVKGDRWSKIKAGITGVGDKVEIELTVLAKQINEGNFKNWVRNVERPQGKIYHTIAEGTVKDGLTEFDAMLGQADSKISLGVLNTVGYMLLKEGRVDDAIDVFRHNLLAFPDEGGLYDSLGEAYAVKGEWGEAIKQYKIALEKDPQNANAIEILRHMEN